MNPDEVIPEDLKMQINNLLWNTLPELTTLEKADALSTDIYYMIQGFWELKEKEKQCNKIQAT